MQIDAITYRVPWSYPGHASHWGERLHGFCFGPPIGLRLLGERDPADAWCGPLADDVPAAALQVLAAGPRPAFALLGPPDFDGALERQCTDALDLARTGDRAGARQRLRRISRLLDARLTLGYINALWSISRARNDFSDIVAVVEGSVCAGFTGMLPWSEPTNRPFLRALQALAWCSWRDGHFGDARYILDSLLWLNPSDDLDACEWIARIDHAVTRDSPDFPCLV